MANFVTQVTAHDFLIREEIEPAPKLIGHLIVSEKTTGKNPAMLEGCVPQYGFAITDNDGNLIAEIAPGWYSAVQAVITGFLQNYGETPGFKADWTELRNIGLVPNGIED